MAFSIGLFAPAALLSCPAHLEATPKDAQKQMAVSQLGELVAKKAMHL